MYLTARTKLCLIAALAVVLSAAGQHAWSAADNDSFEDRFAIESSRSIGPLLAMGELSLLTDGKAAKSEMIQGAKALVATTVFTELLKRVVSEDRPNSESDTSFPSGHTSSAFAMATVVADYKPKYKWLAYGAATAVGWSRIDVEAHHWQDVIAGAALGYFTAKHFTRQHLEIYPGGISYLWKW